MLNTGNHSYIWGNSVIIDTTFSNNDKLTLLLRNAFTISLSVSQGIFPASSRQEDSAEV